MSVLYEQHERWRGAQDRLGVAPAPRNLARMVRDKANRAVVIDPKAPAPFDLLSRPNGGIIIKFVALKRGVTVADIVGPSRKWVHVRPRQEASYLLRKHTEMSLPQIGFRLGDRDHTTILHGIKCEERRRAEAKGFSTLSPQFNDAHNDAALTLAQPQQLGLGDDVPARSVGVCPQ